MRTRPHRRPTPAASKSAEMASIELKFMYSLRTDAPPRAFRYEYQDAEPGQQTATGPRKPAIPTDLPVLRPTTSAPELRRVPYGSRAQTPPDWSVASGSLPKGPLPRYHLATQIQPLHALQKKRFSSEAQRHAHAIEVERRANDLQVFAERRAAQRSRRAQRSAEMELQLLRSRERLADQLVRMQLVLPPKQAAYFEKAADASWKLERAVAEGADQAGWQAEAAAALAMDVKSERPIRHALVESARSRHQQSVVEARMASTAIEVAESAGDDPATRDVWPGSTMVCSTPAIPVWPQKEAQRRRPKRSSSVDGGRGTMPTAAEEETPMEVAMRANAGEEVTPNAPRPAPSSGPVVRHRHGNIGYGYVRAADSDEAVDDDEAAQVAVQPSLTQVG